MKKILLILIIILIPTFAIAGVDDSGLQVYTIDGGKIIGMQKQELTATYSTLINDEVSNSELPYSGNITNMFPKDNSLQNLPLQLTATLNTDFTSSALLNSKNIKILNNEDFYIYSILDETSNRRTYAYCKIADTITDLNGTYTSKTTGSPDANFQVPIYLNNRSKIFVNPLRIGGYKNLIFFKGYSNAGVLYDALYNETSISKRYIYDDKLFYQNSSCAEEWNGRLFIGSQNGNLYFSTTTDYTNFTVSGSGGGVINMPDGSAIYNLQATSLGLIIFASKGAWLLSGDVNASSWTLKKIFNYSGNDIICCGDGINVFFVVNQVLYLIENSTNFTLLNTLKYLDNIDNIDINYYDKKIFFYNNDAGSSHQRNFFYDILSKSFYNINMQSSYNELFATFKYGKIYLWAMTNLTKIKDYANYPIKFKTSLLSLNGFQNYKKIKRIEIDCDFNINTNEVTFSFDDYNNTWTTSAVSLTKFDIYTGENTSSYSITLNDLNESNGFVRTYSYDVCADALMNSPINVIGNKFSFGMTSSGYLNLKQIRIYFYNLGNYKMNGR